MTDALPYQHLANAVLALHVAIVFSAIIALGVILLGNLLRWRWVNSWWFRLAHLAVIAIVVAESWLGITCPLTTLEMALRARAHQTTYAGGFIEHWLQSLLYFNAPDWVFTLSYSLFGLAVLLTWWFFPPRRKLQPPSPASAGASRTAR